MERGYVEDGWEQDVTCQISLNRPKQVLCNLEHVRDEREIGSERGMDAPQSEDREEEWIDYLDGEPLYIGAWVR